MLLLRWIRREGLTFPQAADLFGGVSWQHVANCAHLQRGPSPALLARITAATGGAVTAADFAAVPTRCGQREGRRVADPARQKARRALRLEALKGAA